MNDDYLKWMLEFYEDCELVEFDKNTWGRSNINKFKSNKNPNVLFQIGWHYDNWILKRHQIFELDKIINRKYDE